MSEQLPICNPCKEAQKAGKDYNHTGCTNTQLSQYRTKSGTEYINEYCCCGFVILQQR